jgi:dihydrofolate synthase / folylpolyglutamate synthase
VLARFFDAERLAGRKLTVLMGMLANKDIAGFLQPLRDCLGHVHTVPVDRHASHAPEAIAALVRNWGVAASTYDALDAGIAGVAAQNDGAPLLITGSLYLAGQVLERNGQLPD